MQLASLRCQHWELAYRTKSVRRISDTNVYPGEVNTALLEQRPTPVSDEHRQKILTPEDIANVVVGLASLPARVHVPEIVIKPVNQQYY